MCYSKRIFLFSLIFFSFSFFFVLPFLLILFFLSNFCLQPNKKFKKIPSKRRNTHSRKHPILNKQKICIQNIKYPKIRNNSFFFDIHHPNRQKSSAFFLGRKSWSPCLGQHLFESIFVSLEEFTVIYYNNNQRVLQNSDCLFLICYLIFGLICGEIQQELIAGPNNTY